MSNINKQLKELYSSKWEKLTIEMNKIIADTTKPIKPANPLLLYVDNEDEWESADIKIMFFGQETNGWEKLFSKDIDTLQNVYNGHYNKGGGYKYGYAFWNSILKLKNSIEKQYPDKKIKMIGNNLIKIGKSSDKNRPPGYIRDIELNHFSVIKDEIAILRPYIIWFLTGPNYDGDIKNIFKEAEHVCIAPYVRKYISILPINDIPFSFRTYHPGQRSNNTGITNDQYCNDILLVTEDFYSNKSRLKAIKLFKEQLNEVKINLGAEINYWTLSNGDKFGIEESDATFQKNQTEKYSIGIGFDSTFKDFYFGIKNSDKTLPLPNSIVELCNEKFGIGEQGTPDWSWSKYFDKNREWNEDTFEEIINGTLIQEIIAKLGGILSILESHTS